MEFCYHSFLITWPYSAPCQPPTRLQISGAILTPNRVSKLTFRAIRPQPGQFLNSAKIPLSFPWFYRPQSYVHQKKTKIAKKLMERRLLATSKKRKSKKRKLNFGSLETPQYNTTIHSTQSTVVPPMPRPRHRDDHRGSRLIFDA